MRRGVRSNGGREMCLHPPRFGSSSNFCFYPDQMHGAVAVGAWRNPVQQKRDCTGGDRRILDRLNHLPHDDDSGSDDEEFVRYLGSVIPVDLKRRLSSPTDDDGGDGRISATLCKKQRSMAGVSVVTEAASFCCGVDVEMMGVTAVGPSTDPPRTAAAEEDDEEDIESMFNGILTSFRNLMNVD